MMIHVSLLQITLFVIVVPPQWVDGGVIGGVEEQVRMPFSFFCIDYQYHYHYLYYCLHLQYDVEEELEKK